MQGRGCLNTQTFLFINSKMMLLDVKIECLLSQFHLRVSGPFQGEKILFILEEDELLDEDFIVYLTEFIVSADITALFTSEEMTTIINSIRTEVTQAGLTYTREVAWDFFLKYVFHTTFFSDCAMFPNSNRPPFTIYLATCICKDIL